MFKLFIVCGVLLLCITSANSIDKMKVLQIIKAAKKHKAVKNIKITQEKPIVVYSYKGNSKIPQESYGKLLDIPPSSVLLQKMFSIKEKNIKQNKTFFKRPIQTKFKGIKTQATKIKFY